MKVSVQYESLAMLPIVVHPRVRNVLINEKYRQIGAYYYQRISDIEMHVPGSNAWVRLDENSRKFLLAEASREIGRRSFVGAMVYFATIAVLPLASSVWKEHPRLTLAAFAITFVAGLARTATARLLSRNHSTRRSFTLAFQFSVLATAAPWGLFCAAAFYFYGSTWASTYLLIAGAALAGGVTNSLAPDIQLAAGALLSIIFPTVVVAMIVGTPASVILGISALGYLLYLLGQAQYNWRAYWKAAAAPALEALLSREAASRSEAKFQTLFENAPSGIYVAFRDGRVEIANAGLAQMLGYGRASDIEGRSLKEFSPEWDRAEPSAAIGDKGSITGWESDWHRADGSQIRVWQSIRAVQTEASGRERLLGIVEDVSARFAAEQIRRELIEILEGTSDFVESIAATGKTLYLNRASRTLMGPQSNELQSLWNRTGDEALRATRLRFADEHGVWQGESWIHAADGRPIPVSQVIISHRLSDGRTHSYSIISRDITAMREAQGALREAGERLFQAERIESLGRLAGGIAHDFNNLLTVIMGHASVIEPEVNDEATRAGIQEIAKAAERAAQLTKQLLAFGRRQVLAKGVCDINEVVRGAERMLGRLIGERIDLVTKLSDERQTVIVDAAQLEQVLVNLILNARDAMPHGGTATIETSVVHEDEQTGAGGLAKDWIRIRVSDTGIGMDEVTMAHIFEPFFTTKSMGRGTGLGLATAYGFITQSGGEISVSSKTGVGTRFEVRLPRCGDSEIVPEVRAPVADLDAIGAERVLVVDDEAGVRGLMRQALAGHGYHVVEAGDGEEALLRARELEEPIDLLVTDVVMPGMTGPQLASLLKSQFPRLAVVFVSGYPGETEAERAAFGPEAVYLSKPFTAEMLLRHARQQLDAVRGLTAKA